MTDLSHHQFHHHHHPPTPHYHPSLDITSSSPTDELLADATPANNLLSLGLYMYLIVGDGYLAHNTHLTLQ